MILRVAIFHGFKNMTATIEKTPKTTTTAQSSTITDNLDGSFDLHGELADRVRAGATARGITPDEYADLAIQRGLAIMEERRGKLPIYLDAALVAKIRASLTAVRRDETAEEFITEMFEDMLLPDSGVFNGLIESDDEPDRQGIEAELKRIREQDPAQVVLDLQAGFERWLDQ